MDKIMAIYSFFLQLIKLFVMNVHQFAFKKRSVKGQYGLALFDLAPRRAGLLSNH